jgi:hypothetical protein
MNKDSILNKFQPEKIDYSDLNQFEDSDIEKALELEAKRN